MAVVGPEPPASSDEGPAPGGRLRFILRSALPHLPQLDLTSTDDLLALPDGQRLVILAGTGQRLSYAVQSRLGLEAIHPGRSGVLDAFATASVITEKRAAIIMAASVRGKEPRRHSPCPFPAPPPNADARRGGRGGQPRTDDHHRHSMAS